MNLYLDASALVKRYVHEAGSELVLTTMNSAGAWFICRTGFVEVTRALGIIAGRVATRNFHTEWPSFSVIDVDQELVEQASALALRHGLRSLDALHLAAAFILPRDDLHFITWDGGLGNAARREMLAVVPGVAG